MSDIKVINITDSSFKMWESDASGGVAGRATSDRNNQYNQDQDFDEKSENLFESSTISGGSDNGFRTGDFDAFNKTAGDELDLFEDNASSFSDQSGGSKKNKSVSDSESDSESDIVSDREKRGERELEDDESLLEELSRDPLMIVLGNFLISRKGNNIADILEDIRDHLGYIRHYLSEVSEAKRS